MPISAFRRLVLAVASGAPLLLGALQPAAAQRFDAESFTLANGLQVVVVTNRRVPAVTHMVWYKVGSADEARGKSGIAHFLEHLMFKGTINTPPGAFSRLVTESGGRENAFTTADYTGYFQTVAVERLPEMMRLEADRMANLTLTDALVVPELQVVLEERRMRTDNDPAALLREQVSTALFLNHPYRIPVIGWENEIKGLNRDDALAFYRTWYAPNNAVLVVAGDIDAATLKPLAERYYGGIPGHPVPTRARVQEPERVAEVRLELKSPRVRQPNWNRSVLAPSYTAGDTRFAYPLQIFADVMGGGSSSRLYRALVVEAKLATSAGAWYEPGSLDLTTFGFYFSPRPGVTVATLEAAMDKEIRKALDEGLTAEEVERSKRLAQAEVVYATDSLAGPARLIGAALVNGRTLEDVQQWPDRIGAVTVEQVNEAARAILKDKPAVTGILLPQSDG